MGPGNPKHSFSYVLGSGFVVTGLQAVFYLFFATLLEPENYGEMSYLIALAGTFSIVSRIGLPYTVTVYQSKGKSIIANQANLLVVILSIIAAIILLPISFFAALLSFSLSYFAMNQHNLLGLKKYKKYFLTGLLKSSMIILLPILFYFVFDIPGILIGMAFSNLLGSYNFLKSLKLTKSFNELKTNYKVVLHNFGIDVSSSLTRVIDKIIIVPLFGFVYTGIYQFNIQILFVLAILPTALHSFLLSEEAAGKYHKTINYTVIFVSILLVILSIFFAPTIINNIFPKFAEGIQSLQLLLISLIPLSLSAILTAKLQAKESTKVGYAAAVRIGFLILFITIFGQIYGLLGLALSILLSVIFETIILVTLYQKQKLKKSI